MSDSRNGNKAKVHGFEEMKDPLGSKLVNNKCLVITKYNRALGVTGRNKAVEGSR